MAKEWMVALIGCAFPKSQWRSEQQFRLWLPVLKQVDQRVLVIERNQFWIERV